MLGIKLYVKCVCLQVSSNAGLVSHFVNLQIVVPEAKIQGTGSGEHHVDVGSVIDLICIIEKVTRIINIYRKIL